MELSWTSFIIEMINFLVLVWILKRFFYLPIQNIILQRTQAVQLNMDKAQHLHDEAEKLKETYANRLNHWEIEKAGKRKVFQQELDDLKSKKLNQLEKQLNEEKDKMYSREKQKIAEIIEENTKESFTLAGQFAAKFLTRFADSELERKIIDNIIITLAHLSEEQRQFLNTSYQQQKIEFSSAYPINEQQQKTLIAAVKKLLNRDIDICFTQNSSLIAGADIKIGSALLQANLRDELKFFTDLKYEDS